MNYRKLIGGLLILLGVGICAVWLGSFIAMLYERWTVHHASDYWDSFGAYFWQVGKTDLVLSVLCGSIPVLAGIYQLRKR